MSTKNTAPLDVRAIEAFLAVMASGSMTAAAKQLGIGQPSVTRLVRDLENELGFDFFHRNGPRISPTERGLLFYEDAQRLMTSFRQIRERAEAIREERIPAIDIVATPTMAGGLLPPTLARLGEDLPDLINAQTMDAEHIVRALRNRSADFGITALPLDHAELTCHIRCDARLVAVVAEGSALAGEAPVALDVFRDTRLITVGNSFRIRHAIDLALEDAGVQPAREFQSNSSLNAVMAARAGLGIAIVDPVTAFGIPVKGVAIRPLAREIPYSWGVFSAADTANSSLKQAFIEAARMASDEIVKQLL